MIPQRHVARLAAGRCDTVRQGAVLLEQIAHAVLGGAPHLPLRVVEAHVAGLTGLGLARLEHREGMARVAGVARGEAVARARILQARDLGRVLQADLVSYNFV